MLRVEIRFPLGVYHALSNVSFSQPEWPPSPVRLIGALLAAAHEAPGSNTDEARILLQRLCTAAPPVLVAPTMIGIGEPAQDGRRLGSDAVVGFRGASRWAPRNHSGSELGGGVSPRDLGRGRTEVHKGGVAIGDQTIEVRWEDLDLTPEERDQLGALLDELTFLGTSRSPAVARIIPTPPSDDAVERWEPAATGQRGETDVRVPDPNLLQAFDQRHEARSSRGKKPITASDHVPALGLGRTIPYVLRTHRLEAEARAPVDPQQWGEMIVLELDPGGDERHPGSELRPKASAGFLFARAFREALLGAFGAIGTPDEAPPVLVGRGEEAHAAIVPLPFVGWIPRRSSRNGIEREHRIPADGIIRGIAVLLPHENRLPDVAAQRLRVEQGLLRFVAGERRWIDIPGSGRVFLRLPSPDRSRLLTLQDDRYRHASRVWETVLPVVHAHRRTSTGPRGVLRQVAADCQHVGLPEPVAVEVLTEAPLGGAPNLLLRDDRIPAEWRGPLQGPRSHLRITFERPVVGPVILGRARHFGVGLCLPNRAADREIASGAPSQEIAEAPAVGATA